MPSCLANDRLSEVEDTRAVVQGRSPSSRLRQSLGRHTTRWIKSVVATENRARHCWRSYGCPAERCSDECSRWSSLRIDEEHAHHWPVNNWAHSPTREDPRASRRCSRPPASRHRRPEPSPLPRSSVDPVPKPEPTSASRTEPRAHQFPSTGTTGWEADPRADDLFHEPETHPNPTHTRTHPATVATTQTPPGCHPRDTAW
jgi:hypothetical protein